MSAFSLLIPPAFLTKYLQRRTERSSTTPSYLEVRSFGVWFSPVKSSVQDFSTSELLRFL